MEGVLLFICWIRQIPLHFVAWNTTPNYSWYGGNSTCEYIVGYLYWDYFNVKNILCPDLHQCFGFEMNYGSGVFKLSFPESFIFLQLTLGHRETWFFNQFSGGVTQLCLHWRVIIRHQTRNNHPYLILFIVSINTSLVYIPLLPP